MLLLPVNMDLPATIQTPDFPIHLTQGYHFQIISQFL